MKIDFMTMRKATGLTQKQLADLAGVNVSLIQKIEYGTYRLSNITAINLLRIAAVLGVDPYDLIGLSRDEIPRA